MAMTFLYHETTPEGRLFDVTEKDIKELAEKGWVDSPALLGKKEQPKPKRGRPDSKKKK